MLDLEKGGDGGFGSFMFTSIQAALYIGVMAIGRDKMRLEEQYFGSDVNNRACNGLVFSEKSIEACLEGDFSLIDPDNLI